MKSSLFILSFFIIFISCGERKKYEMNNMISEMIDVTDYIENGKFIPDSCEGRLDKLIKVKPVFLDKSFENKLQKKITKWKNNTNENSKSTYSLFKNTTYQYSYIIVSEPVDVYKTELENNINTPKKLYIRINQKGEIISDYSEVNWVENNCEKNN